VFDTPIVIVGNVLTAPEWRRTKKTQTLVANFRVASTSRRFDRENNRWIDGDSLRVRVNCWRKLAENVGASITVGDPIVVVGRLYTRDWIDSENNPRTTFEMDATAVGHDLARGRTKLFRNKAAAASMIEGPEADGQVRGESADLVGDNEVPTGYGQGIPDDEEPPVFIEDLPVTVLAGGGFEPFDTTAAPEQPAPEQPASEQPASEQPAPEQPASEERPDEIAIEVEALSEPAAPRRSRRARREPVAA
jgi:single-strand DNA-binding protein